MVLAGHSLGGVILFELLRTGSPKLSFVPQEGLEGLGLVRLGPGFSAENWSNAESFIDLKV